MTTQNHLVFPVRRASGTFFFSAFFLSHVVVLVSVLGSVPTVGTNEQAILGISAYALSFAVSLLSGLCLVSSVYAPHYIKIGLMISVPNVALFFFMPHPPIEAVLLLIANQAMASIFLLGGLLMSFLVPFKMVKSAKLHPVHQEAQTQFVIPIPPAAEQPVSMNSTLGSFPETPRSSRFQQPSLPRTPVSRPAFFAEAEQERSPTQTGSIFPPPLYKAY